jgi:zinc transport system substrate-binding protein
MRGNRPSKAFPISAAFSAAFFALLLVCLLLSTVFLTGCTPSPEGSTAVGGEIDAGSSKTLTIVCTAFPQYDWTRNLVGRASDHVEVLLLNNRGTDMHSFQPTAENMVNIANCDLFIHIGGFSETWVEAALQSAGNDHAVVLALLDQVDKQEEVIIEGMTSNEEEDGEDAREEDAREEDARGEDGDQGSKEIEYDEHLWLSLRRAQEACQAIVHTLCRLDPDYAGLYQENLASYTDQLQHLDEAYMEVTSQATTKTLLFADRFPFRYLTDDYDLEYFAAFPGCSAETEASFETIVYLSEEVDAHRLSAVLVLEGSQTDLAKTIIGNTQAKNARILTLNSMQSVTEKQIEGGLTYLSVMEENRKVLAEALK